MLTRDAAFRCLKCFDDVSARVQVFATGGCERHAARGALDEDAIELPFKLRKQPADVGQRCAQAARRRRQAACVGDRNERLHGAEAVHSTLP